MITYWEIEQGVRPGPRQDDKLVSVMAFPLLTVFITLQTLASLPRVMVKSVGVLVLLLGLNLLFIHVIDPLEPLVRNLPSPPALGRS